MNNNKLLLLETLGDAKHYLNNLFNKDDRVENCEILSFQPDIQALLQKNQIHSISSAEISVTQLYYDVMDKLEGIENSIERYNTDENIILPESWFIDAFNYYFRYMCFYLLWDIEVLYKIIKDSEYNILITFRGDTSSVTSPWLLPEQHCLDELGVQLCNFMGIDHYSIDISTKSEPINGKSKRQSSINKICNILSFYLARMSAFIEPNSVSLYTGSFAKNIDLICTELNSINKNINVFSIGPSFEGIGELKNVIKSLANQLTRKNKNNMKLFGKYYLSIPMHTFCRYYEHNNNYINEIGYIKHILQQLKFDQNSKTIFRGVNIYTIIRKKVLGDIQSYLLGIVKKAVGLRKVLEIYRPNYVLSFKNLGLSSALGQICTNLGIRSILISHGSHVKHGDKYSAKGNEIIARNILVGKYRYLAVQSPLAREMAIHLNNNSSKIVNIKPVIWGRRVNRYFIKNSDYITIVHASSFKTANRRFMYETSDEMLMGIRELCEVISGKKSLKLIIKFRHGPEFSTESLHALLSDLPNNISIETEKSLFNILRETDLLVSFSSTTIEEALVNRIPVLLYGGHGRYAHIPVEPYSDLNNNISRAVTFIKHKQDLHNYFKTLNQAGPTFKVPDKEFNKYRFGDDEAVDFVDWFSGLIEASS
tara:strand:+ start:2287 stop:4239 length:1953 start_codon:yes stop_codon:yes gene_type:complete